MDKTKNKIDIHLIETYLKINQYVFKHNIIQLP